MGRYTLAKKAVCIRLAKGEQLKGFSSMHQPVASLGSSSYVMNPAPIKSLESGTKAGCAPPQYNYGMHNPRVDTKTQEQQKLYDSIILQLSQADKRFITIYTQEMLHSLPEKLTQKLVCIKPFQLFDVLL